MRLLLINYELPPIGGGGGRATLRLGEEFVRLGHEVEIVSSAFGDLPRVEEREGLTIRRIPVWRPHADRCPPKHMITFVWSSLWHGTRIARRFRPDLVFAFFGIPCGSVARRIKRKLGAPYALSLRGSDVPRPELGHQRLMEAIVRPTLRRVWRDADLLISVGEGLKQAALAVEPGLDIEVIPNGVDVERFRPVDRSGREGLRLLFVGRLREFKGLQFVLEAMGETGDPRVCLDIVGEGPYRAELGRRVAQHDLADRVTFHGWLAPADVPERYAAADALVLPSFAEGSPNVILEAMAAGLPVVASDAPGCREAVRDAETGLLVPVGDVAGLRRAFDHLARDPDERAGLGAAGRRAAEQISWTRVAERHLALFERVVRGGV